MIKILAYAHFDAAKIMTGVSHSENLMINSMMLMKWQQGAADT